jgi:hypothetical protein
MNKTPATGASADTFVLAGRNENGMWQKIETATREEDETAADVKAFLETMGHASSRTFTGLEILTEEEFNRRASASPEAAA